MVARSTVTAPHLISDLAREYAYFWRHDDLHGMEMLHAYYVTHTFPRHTHDTYTIAAIERGGDCFWWRGNTVVAPAGSVFVVPPGEVHTGEPLREHGWLYRVAYVSPDWLHRIAADITGKPSAAGGAVAFRDGIFDDRDLNQLLLLILSTLEKGLSSLERQSQMLWVLSLLLRRHAALQPMVPGGNEPYYVQQVRAYLHAHYASNVTLDELAALVNFSPYYLLRSFRRVVGLPPHAYLMSVRINHARRLLQAGVSAAEVAARTGFADQSHLSRHFKRIVGVPPGQYRRAQLPVAPGA